MEVETGYLMKVRTSLDLEAKRITLMRTGHHIKTHDTKA